MTSPQRSRSRRSRTRESVGGQEAAAPTFKRRFGFHPLWAFVDHGTAGTGEPLAFLLREGNAGGAKSWR